MFSRDRVYGVARVGASPDEVSLSADQLALSITFLHQISSGIEREHYHDRIKSLIVIEETQKL